MNLPEINKSQLNNVFEVNKLLGLATNAYVEYYKRVLQTKVGQGGTLDPLADGKIVILTGRSTKLAQTYLDHKKVYDMTVLLGAKSASGDIEQPLEIDENVGKFDITKVAEIINSFEGESIQRVPLFSAAKQEGKSQYKMMRDGGQPPVPKERAVTIHITEQPVLKEVKGSELVELIDSKITEITESFATMAKLFQEVNAFMPGKFLWVKDAILQNLNSEKERFSSEFADISFTLITFSAEVTKGTYMRSLAEDIAEKLGTYGVTFNLRRTGV